MSDNGSKIIFLTILAKNSYCTDHVSDFICIISSAYFVSLSTYEMGGIFVPISPMCIPQNQEVTLFVQDTEQVKCWSWI